MDDILSKIIEIENQAKSMTEQSEQKLSGVKDTIKEKVDELENKYAKLSKDEVQKARTKEQLAVRSKSVEIKTAFNNATEQLDKDYAEGKDTWVKQIVDRTLSV